MISMYVGFFFSAYIAYHTRIHSHLQFSTTMWESGGGGERGKHQVRLFIPRQRQGVTECKNNKHFTRRRIAFFIFFADYAGMGMLVACCASRFYCNTIDARGT